MWFCARSSEGFVADLRHRIDRREGLRDEHAHVHAKRVEFVARIPRLSNKRQREFSITARIVKITAIPKIIVTMAKRSAKRNRSTEGSRGVGALVGVGASS